MKSRKIISLNPSKNYAVIGEVAFSTGDEIDNKVAQARAAQQAWAAFDIKERVAKLEKLYHAFEKRKDEIVSIAAREMGLPISVNKDIDLGPGFQYMRGMLDFAPQWLGK